jgi:hypothetical protein
LPYTYGFLVDGKVLEPLLIRRGTPIAHGAGQVTRQMPPLSVKPGMVLDISLYMRIEKTGGVEHWRLGRNYTFAPVSEAGQPTAVQPSIAVGTDETCMLNIRDLVSGQALPLVLHDDQRERIGEPEVLNVLDIKDLPPDIRKTVEEAMRTGEFSADVVDTEREKALVYERAIRQAIAADRPLPSSEAIGRYRKLSELSPKVAPGKAIKVESPEARIFQELLNARAELQNILLLEHYQV